MFIAASFRITETWKQPKHPPTDEWIKEMWYIFIYNGILSSHEKEGNPASCNNMDGTWRHSVKWNKTKTSTVSSHLHMESFFFIFFFLHMESERKNKLTETESRLVVPWTAEWRMCRRQSKGTNFQLQNEKVLGVLIYSMVTMLTTVYYILIIYLKVAKRVEPKCSHHKRRR